MTKNKKNNKGFTILELTITMAVLLVLLLIGYTSFDSATKKQNAQMGISQIGYALKKARYYARAKGVLTHVDLQVGASDYEVYAGNTLISNSNNFDATSGKLPKGVIITQNTCTEGEPLYFYIDGSPLADNNPDNVIASDCIITVGSKNGPNKSLSIKGNSGNISYE